MRDVKILCTIGPACNDVRTIGEMIEAGMDGARVNLSHGSASSQGDKLENFRRACELKSAYGCSIMFDIRGPEIRVKEIPGGELLLEDGDMVTLHCEGDGGQAAGEQAGGGSGGPGGGTVSSGQAGGGSGGSGGDMAAGGGPGGGTVSSGQAGGEYNAGMVLRVNYAQLPQQVATGTEILIDDGKIRLTVDSICGSDIICCVETGGPVKSRKGVNLPDVKLQMDYLSEDDKEDILYCIENRVDYVAGSFIRREDDVKTLRNFLDANGGSDIGIIAKIESKEAVSNLEGIAKSANQVLVARGDLGVEVGMEKVPAIQKRIVRKCRELGTAVIIATQLIDSMTENPLPTRAEVSDIANAVYDGATDLLVTGETAAGKYPVEVVKMLDRIIAQAESDLARYGGEML